MTRSGGVSCVNENNGNTRRFRLVNQKLPQLVKGPIAEKPAHLFRLFITPKTVGSLSYPLKVFESECLLRGKCASDKFFADNVVRIFDEPRLTAARFLEPLVGRTRVLLLELTTMFPNAAANRLDDRTRVLIAFAVGSNLGDA